jgi:hypothetical protein
MLIKFSEEQTKLKKETNKTLEKDKKWIYKQEGNADGEREEMNKENKQNMRRGKRMKQRKK